LRKLFDSEDFKFDRITTIIDQPKHFIEERLDQVFSESSFNDFLLIYFSGHGKLNSKGELFLSCRNTKEKLLNGTGFKYRHLMEMLDAHQADRVAILLDCCYAGRAVTGLRGSIPEQVNSQLDSGRGIFVLGASGATQTAEERELDGHGIFTRQVIEGLVTGAADVDNDGQISLHDLAKYVHDEFRRQALAQEPFMAGLAKSGDLILGINRRASHMKKVAAIRLKVEQTKSHFSKATYRAIEDYLDEILESQSPPEGRGFKALTAFEAGGPIEDVFNAFRLEPGVKISPAIESKSFEREQQNTERSGSASREKLGDQSFVEGLRGYKAVEPSNRAQKSLVWSVFGLATLANLLIWLLQAQIIDGLGSLWNFVSAIGFKAFVPEPETIIQSSQWLIPAPVLIAIAWVRFNSPPTNRLGTTFVLFFVGLLLYCLLILALWLLSVIAVRQASILFPKAVVEFPETTPLVAALLIVVAQQFSWFRRIDDAARAFCTTLAGIPREAERLTLELARTAIFLPKSQRLRGHVSKIITETIGAQALRFEPDGSLAARFTRAVGLYCLFVTPYTSAMQLDFANTNTRRAYTRVMQLSEATVARTHARYEELIQSALAYFTHPSKEIEETLKRSIIEVTQLTCSLIARDVLYCNMTARGRRRQLSNMGFNPTHQMPWDDIGSRAHS
jgi:hypothetical protein